MNVAEIVHVILWTALHGVYYVRLHEAVAFSFDVLYVAERVIKLSNALIYFT